MRGRDPDLVWSSDDGDLRRSGRDSGRGRGPKGKGGRGSGSAPPPSPASGGRAKVRRETAGRRGKTVTTVSGAPVDEEGLRVLAGKLKKRCGVGGSAKGGIIELQGDHRDTVMEVLAAEGIDAVLAGG